LPAVAVTAVGESGTVAGVAETITVEESEFPTALVEITVNVYVVPVVKPRTVTGELELLPVNPPGEATTV
jgi:hypothetical protein